MEGTLLWGIVMIIIIIIIIIVITVVCRFASVSSPIFKGLNTFHLLPRCLKLYAHIYSLA